MQYYRCRCGKRETWGSSGPHLCAWCTECNSSIAIGPGAHRDLRIPHALFKEKLEADAPGAVLTRCTFCLDTRAEIEARGEPWRWRCFRCGGSQTIPTYPEGVIFPTGFKPCPCRETPEPEPEVKP